MQSQRHGCSRRFQDIKCGDNEQSQQTASRNEIIVSRTRGGHNLLTRLPKDPSCKVCNLTTKLKRVAKRSRRKERTASRESQKSETRSPQIKRLWAWRASREVDFGILSRRCLPEMHCARKAARAGGDW